MAIRDILLLGNPRLYEISSPVLPDELVGLLSTVDDLRDTLLDFRSRNGAGRAIAAPQIGVMKRLIYMSADTPQVLINPVIEDKSVEMIELWDDCLSFPDLLVKVQRHKTCRISFRDFDWQEHSLTLADSLSELLQHECDHLDGILAVARATDPQGIALKSQRNFLR
jgi:peptide deformylase